MAKRRYPFNDEDLVKLWYNDKPEEMSAEEVAEALVSLEIFMSDMKMLAEKYETAAAEILEVDDPIRTSSGRIVEVKSATSWTKWKKDELFNEVVGRRSRVFVDPATGETITGFTIGDVVASMDVKTTVTALKILGKKQEDYAQKTEKLKVRLY